MRDEVQRRWQCAHVFCFGQPLRVNRWQSLCEELAPVKKLTPSIDENQQNGNHRSNNLMPLRLLAVAQYKDLVHIFPVSPPHSKRYRPFPKITASASMIEREVDCGIDAC